MKKTYIAPEVEITRFSTEDIMAGSAVYTNTSSADSYAAAENKVSVDYSTLFGA